MRDETEGALTEDAGPFSESVATSGNSMMGGKALESHVHP